MKMRKVVSAMLVAAMATGMVAGCGSSSDSKSDKKDAKGKVYYLNFKPEQDEQWQDLAKEYTKETGVDVTVLTAASGEYEKTLKSEMAKSNAPTLFQVNGPVGLASWKDYCYDLKDSDVAKQLTSDDFALMDGDKMSGIAYVIESYGIIYNKELLKKAGYSADDITNFDSFKKVVEDITANKDKLGFSAFTSAGMDGSSDWRFKTHLANLPIYYEYKDEGIDNTDAIKGTYLDNYRQIWDLYINNATCKPTELSTKTADDATADFVTGDAVFYQNGTWEYNNIKDVGDDNLGILPIYIGVEGEEDQGICTGTENYWCVNSKASDVVLVSGGGTNLQAIIDAVDSGEITNTKIAGVISNNKNAYALERAEKHGIPNQCISPKDYESREIFNQEFMKAVDVMQPDLIVLAGFLVVIPAEMIAKYRNRMINIHPSLIPAFCGTGFYGLKVHEKALERGVKVVGATVHFVDEGTDTGPIILQKAVEVEQGDTPEVLQRRVMEQAEWRILPRAIDLIANGKVKVEGHRVTIES